MTIKIFPIKSEYDCILLKDSLQISDNEKPFQHILNLAQHHKVKTVLLEDNYNAEDYIIEHDLHYKYLFKQYPTKTTRLHFFDTIIDKKNLKNIGNFNKNYIGFCILRPLPAQKTFLAILKPIEDENSPKKSFVLCQTTYKVAINGQTLRITGYPFMQQDSQLGSCAHAALLMVSKYLSRKFGSREISIRDIVQWVQQVPIIERHIPTPGLLPIQISEVIKQMGYSPLVYQYGKNIESKFAPDRVIYHYNESGLPIIIGIPTSSGGHAIIVVGHSFEPDSWLPLVEIPYYQFPHSGGNYHCSTTWVQNFIVQDDNFGPYLRISKDMLLGLSQQSLVVIVPLPQNVNVQGEDSEIYVHKLVSSPPILKNLENLIKSDVSEKTKKYIGLFLDNLERNEIILRTYLIKSDLYKKNTINDFSNKELISIYKKMEMPEWIWVSEISVSSIFCYQRRMLGEVIIDSTATPRFGPYFLSIHLPGIFLERNVKTEDLKSYKLKNDVPYSHLIR